MGNIQQIHLVVLFRAGLAEEYELEACKKVFGPERVITQRSKVAGELVIPRYSALPFYKEFEEDVHNMDGKLINSHREHLYVADIKNWYYDLIDLTPKTWFELHNVPKDGGPFVLKGSTNSKKHAWNTHMYAENWEALNKVYTNLTQDSYIGGNQDIVVRQYVPLKKLVQGFQGLPISEEYRFFIHNKKILTGAFYWSEWYSDIPDEIRKTLSADNVPKEFLNEVIERVGNNIPFYVVDIARTEANEWIVVELNDGSMSGLSMNDPCILYKNLKKSLLDDSDK